MNLTTLRRRRPNVLDPAREPLLRAARDATPGVLPPALEAARASGRALTPAAVRELADVDELEARAIAGLMMAHAVPADARHGTCAQPRLRLRVLTPPQAMAIVSAQRLPLGPGDLHHYGLLSWGAPSRWAAACTHAGLVDNDLIFAWRCAVDSVRQRPWPAPRVSEVPFYHERLARGDLLGALTAAGAIQDSPSPIEAPSLTSIARLDQVIDHVCQHDPVLKEPGVQAATFDVLTLAWAEGQRASLLAGAERIAHELVHQEERLTSLCAQIRAQERRAEAGGPGPDPEDLEARHALLAAIGVARATYAEKCELAASHCALRVEASDSPLQHLYAAELAMLLRQHDVRARHLAAGRPIELANRLMFADPERKPLLAALRAKQADMHGILTAVDQHLDCRVLDLLHRGRDAVGPQRKCVWDTAGWRIEVQGIAFDRDTLAEWHDAVARASRYAE